MSRFAKFGAMIANSTLVMFGLMYLSTCQASHVWFSERRAYMALIMGAAMGWVMLAFMLGMYDRRGANLAMFAAGAAFVAAALWPVRSQSTVEGVAWMKVMLPHHSIAILTRERARMSDPRARDRADRIVGTQREESAEMEQPIRDLDGKRR